MIGRIRKKQHIYFELKKSDLSNEEKKIQISICFVNTCAQLKYPYRDRW